MKFNSIGTAEFTPRVHKSENGLRGLCGTKVLPMTAEQQARADKATTCGEMTDATGHEPCVRCNAKDA